MISGNELTGVHGRNTLFSKLISIYTHYCMPKKIKETNINRPCLDQVTKIYLLSDGNRKRSILTGPPRLLRGVRDMPKSSIRRNSRSPCQIQAHINMNRMILNSWKRPVAQKGKENESNQHTCDSHPVAKVQWIPYHWPVGDWYKGFGRFLWPGSKGIQGHSRTT